MSVHIEKIFLCIEKCENRKSPRGESRHHIVDNLLLVEQRFIDAIMPNGRRRVR